MSGPGRGASLRLVLARFRVFSLTALAVLALVGGEARAQRGRIRPNPAAAEAMRQAYEAEAIARERTMEERRRQREQALDPYDETADLEGMDPLDDFEDPLDEIDHFADIDEADSTLGPAEALHDARNPDRVDTPDLPSAMDEMDALGGFDDELDRTRRDRRDSLTLEMYRAAERGLDEPDSVGGELDLPDAGLDLDPFVEP